MDFCIYFDYEITVNNKYCYINEDGDHTTDTEHFTKIMDGGKLAEFIADYLKDSWFSSLTSKPNGIIISTFCPMDGTGQEITITIKK